MNEAVLVLNAGSSSIKFAVFGLSPCRKAQTLLYKGLVERINPEEARFKASDADGRDLADETLKAEAGERVDHQAMLMTAFAWLRKHAAGVSIVAAGHRVVHGADHYAEPMRLTPQVMATLDSFVPLAPLHQPHNLAAIRALEKVRPDIPQIACFDTAFHRTHPKVAQTFAIPRELNDEGVKRYGFHGLSYEYIARALPEYLGEERAGGRVVVAHLGNGASMAAIANRRSVTSTMGFTALDGLMMGTRCGNLDPGVLLYLMQEKHMDADAITDLLYRKSGLLGVSGGVASDMRTLLASDDPRAAEAVDLFVYRIRRELGSLCAALGGLDALVFTGGIGEHAAEIRGRVCRDAAWLGIELDEAANAGHGPRISTAGSRTSAWVIPTNEEAVIAGHVCRLIG